MTLTTVGYGDLSPSTFPGKLIGKIEFGEHAHATFPHWICQKIFPEMKARRPLLRCCATGKQRQGNFIICTEAGRKEGGEWWHASPPPNIRRPLLLFCSCVKREIISCPCSLLPPPCKGEKGGGRGIMLQRWRPDNKTSIHSSSLQWNKSRPYPQSFLPTGFFWL